MENLITKKELAAILNISDSYLKAILPALQAQGLQEVKIAKTTRKKLFLRSSLDRLLIYAAETGESIIPEEIHV